MRNDSDADRAASKMAIPDTVHGPVTVDGDLTVNGSVQCRSILGNVVSEVFKNQYNGEIRTVTSAPNDQFVIINIIGVHNQRANGDICVSIAITAPNGGSYSMSTHFADTSDDAPIWQTTVCAPVPRGSSYVISSSNYKGLGADIVVTYVDLG